MESDPDSRVGSVLDGRYKVLERLAEGGMGVVYRAERVPVGRPVAVKFLHEVYAADRESRARFERETRVLFKLTHPHCVSVIDFGVDGGPYLVMDFVPGTTLKDRLEHGPIPVAEAITIARQALAGLAHAHTHGIVHRDVKPANIMVSDEIGTGNHVRILDFGLARLRGGAATSVTQTQIVVGTPNYMAPEQTLAEEVDARGDIYAMGIVLFEMITGQRPFTAEDTAGILDAHRNQPPPHLYQVAPDLELPVGLDRVVQRALAKDPGKRYQTAVDMANALEAVAEGRRAPQTEAGLGPRDKKFPWNVVMFCVVLLAGGIAVYVMLHRPSKHQGALVASGSTGSGTAATGSATGSSTAATTGSATGSMRTGSAAVPDTTPDAAPAIAITAEIDAAPIADAAGETMAQGPIDAAPATIDVAPADRDARPDAFTGEVVDPTGTVEEEVAPAADPTAVAPVQAEPDDVDTAGTNDSFNGASATGTGTAVTPPPATGSGSGSAAAGSAPKPTPVVSAAAKKRDAQIDLLRAAWRKSPKKGSLPFQLANLYFQKKWWTIAMEHYRTAIKLASGYRGNGLMIKNVIQALGNSKTRGEAWWFLKNVVGMKYARPYLRVAARSSPKPSIRSAAKAMLK